MGASNTIEHSPARVEASDDVKVDPPDFSTTAEGRLGLSKPPREPDSGRAASSSCNEKVVQEEKEPPLEETGQPPLPVDSTEKASLLESSSVLVCASWKDKPSAAPREPDSGRVASGSCNEEVVQEEKEAPLEETGQPPLPVDSTEKASLLESSSVLVCTPWKDRPSVAPREPDSGRAASGSCSGEVVREEKEPPREETGQPPLSAVSTEEVLLLEDSSISSCALQRSSEDKPCENGSLASLRAERGALEEPSPRSDTLSSRSSCSQQASAVPPPQAPVADAVVAPVVLGEAPQSTPRTRHYCSSSGSPSKKQPALGVPPLPLGSLQAVQEVNQEAAGGEFSTRVESTSVEISQESLMSSRSSIMWSARRSTSPCRASIAQRLRAQRHLEEALAEGAGEVVLRHAIDRAVTSGCTQKLLKDARAMLSKMTGESEGDDGDGEDEDEAMELGQQVLMPQQQPTVEEVVSEASSPFQPTAGAVMDTPTPPQSDVSSPTSAAPIVEGAESSEAQREAIVEAQRIKEEQEVIARRIRDNAEKQLEAATDVESLRKAMSEAQKAGIAPEDLASYEVDLWVADAAYRSFEEAMKSDDATKIRAATEAAKQIKLLASLVTQAGDALEKTYKRRDIKMRLDKALRGLNAAASDDISAAAAAATVLAKASAATAVGGASPEILHEAADAVNAAARAAHRVAETSDTLGSLVKDGRELGVPEPELEKYRTAMQRELRRQAARRQLQLARAEVGTLVTHEMELEPLMQARQMLRDAVNEALEAGLSEEEVGSAVKERQRLHNAVEDRRGAVRVFCRIRPLVTREVVAGETEIVHRCNGFSVRVDSAESTPSTVGGMLSSRSPRVEASSILRSMAKLNIPSTPRSSSQMSAQSEDGALNFDTVWAPGNQAEVFDSVRDLVQSAVDGYNVTVFAYGQTGAGKTFTMYGLPPERQRIRGNPADFASIAAASAATQAEGLCPRAANEVFQITNRNAARIKSTVTLSMVEIYCSRFIDLLEPKSQKELKIRNLPSGEVVLENLSEANVKHPDEVHALVRAGVLQRHSRDTTMNTGSSRSHVLFIMKVHTVSVTSGAEQTGKLLFVDLAGSERIKKSEVSGDGLREAIEINKSLSALGDVVGAIARGDAHVPYRNHELTQLLQDSLGGTAKTLMFVNLSPAASNREESVMSLQFAQRIKGVVNRPVRGATSCSSPVVVPKEY